MRPMHRTSLCRAIHGQIGRAVSRRTNYRIPMPSISKPDKRTKRQWDTTYVTPLPPKSDRMMKKEKIRQVWE